MVSVASHLTFLSRHASQLGSFLRCRYARFWALLLLLEPGKWAWDARGVPATDSPDGKDSRSMTDDVDVTGVYAWKELVGSWWSDGRGGGIPIGCGGAWFDLELDDALLMLALDLIRPPWYCSSGLGEGADEMADES